MLAYALLVNLSKDFTVDDEDEQHETTEEAEEDGEEGIANYGYTVRYNNMV